MADEIPGWACQPNCDVAVEWGPYGLRSLAPTADVVIIVDVLRFTTSVDIVVSRGGSVIAHRFDDPEAAQIAAQATGAIYARNSDHLGPSLSPSSLITLPNGTLVLLPSPNGSALIVGAAEAGAKHVIAGSLRNAAAVATHAASLGRRIAIIPAGERWRGSTGPMRPALEDLLGAGAIISSLVTSRTGLKLSPEAHAALATFRGAEHQLLETLLSTGSGRELVERGLGEDVKIAGDLNVSAAVPLLRNGRLVSTQ